jgi:hypothetical protein
MLIVLFANAGGSSICQEACSCDTEDNYPEVHQPLRAVIQFAEGVIASGSIGKLQFVGVTDGVKSLVCCLRPVGTTSHCKQCAQFYGLQHRDSWLALLLLSMQTLDSCCSTQLGIFASEVEEVVRVRGVRFTAKDIIAGTLDSTTKLIQANCDPGIRWILQRTLATPPTFWLPKSLGIAAVTIYIFISMPGIAKLGQPSASSPTDSSCRWHTVRIFPAAGPRIPESVTQVLQEYIETSLYPESSTMLHSIEMPCPPLLQGRPVTRRATGTLNRLLEGRGCVAVLRVEHADLPTFSSPAARILAIDTNNPCVLIAQAVARTIDAFCGALVPASSPVALLRSSSTKFHVAPDRSALHLDFNQLAAPLVDVGHQLSDGDISAAEADLERVASFALSAATSRSGIEGMAVLVASSAVDDANTFELTARTEVSLVPSPLSPPVTPAANLNLSLLPERPQGDRPPMDRGMGAKQRPGRQLRLLQGVASVDAISYLSASSEDVDN